MFGGYFREKIVDFVDLKFGCFVFDEYVCYFGDVYLLLNCI